MWRVCRQKHRNEFPVSQDVADAWVFVERNVICQQLCIARCIHAFDECREFIDIARSSENFSIYHALVKDRKEQCHSIVEVLLQRDMQSLLILSESERGLHIEIERRFVDRHDVVPSVQNFKRGGEVRLFFINDIRTDSGGEAPLPHVS